MLRNIHYWLPNSTSVGAEQPHVEYESVAEIYDDGSYTVYDFANYHDTPDQFGGNPNILLNPDVYGSPYAWANNFLTQPDYEPPFRGTLLATSYYNSDNKLQKKVTFSYDRSKKRKFVESVKYAASYFYVQRSYLETYPLVRVTTTDYMSDTNTVMTRENLIPTMIWGKRSAHVVRKATDLNRGPMLPMFRISVLPKRLHCRDNRPYMI